MEIGVNRPIVLITGILTLKPAMRAPKARAKIFAYLVWEIVVAKGGLRPVVEN